MTAVVDALKDGGMFILAQDIYMTATARHAHAVLLAAQWGEMNLTSIMVSGGYAFINDLLIHRQAIPDWKIIGKFARRLNRLYQRDRNSLMANKFLDFDWRGDEEVFIDARYSFKGDGTIRWRVMPVGLPMNFTETRQ